MVGWRRRLRGYEALLYDDSRAYGVVGLSVFERFWVEPNLELPRSLGIFKYLLLIFESFT
jgi:hypothetical protein